MGMTAEADKTCVRGCCSSSRIRVTLPTSSFALLSQIAKGAESIVYEARLEGKRVAAKKPILSTTDDLNRFHKELQMLCKLDHPGIVTLLAAHARPPNYLFFFPFYENDNLAEALHAQEWNPSVEKILAISLQLAKVLQYLHNIGIVHRDVKPANILLDSKMDAQLTDFGLAAYEKDLEVISLQNWKSSGKPTGGFHKRTMVGTLIYMAPEVLKKEIHTKKSDIYSFAITINELVTGVVPYTDRRTEAQAHTVLEMNYTEQQLTSAITSEGLRPVLASQNSGVPSRLLSLIEQCWNRNPEQRPSADSLVESLDEIILQYKNEVLQNENINSSGVFESNHINAATSCYNHKKQVDVSWSVQGEVSAQKLCTDTEFALNKWLNPSPGQLMYYPTLSWGSFATCGRRDTMEDTHFLLPHLGNEKYVSAFGVFDGHRGAPAAQFAAQAIPGFLQSSGPFHSPSEALVNSFLKTDILFRNELELQRCSTKGTPKDWHPGCTAAVSLIVENRLFVANAGDCRTILCKNGHAVALSKDHVASCVDERDRVIKAGCQVRWQIDTWRVGSAALQVTRSIGDDDLKPAVTAEPEITETLLSPDDEYLVIASDGLWDTLNNEDVISLIKDTVKEPSMCSKRLATEAVTRGSKDNITVIVVFLNPVTTVERIY
ncbi:hypothetical protein SUGI_0180940 [Cryptomeria japonica]|uniref:protein kinase and PP2C-like domain-containing protein n=1 Tax=Cryptomeria japonica TaxID=3369 RepID=UPI002408EB5B|nr:protein kinase and PP2C-like domain-containing protein [Cryptomeria japonica]GLJ11956.1 hypothetical protein SUGI_0180940 [Cryptomeria japonica]